MTLILYVVGGLLIGVTVLSRVRSARWWIRFTDFPRLQVAVGLVTVGAALLALGPAPSAFAYLFGAALLGSLGYNLTLVLPYTPLAAQQVLRATPGAAEHDIRLLIANLRMGNRRADAILSAVREHEPDVFLAVEGDAWWGERLAALTDAYPHRIEQPQENYYGMHLFSKLPVVAGEVKFRVEADVPSMRAELRLRSGVPIVFHGLHPRPPHPDDDQGSEQRDAELLLVGREVMGDGVPTIVAGDLNDVAWSHTTRLFQRVSGLLDPRRGRGLYATFHADYPLMRWPLDHVFHDGSFTLCALRCLPSIGSDHLPVLIDLRHEPSADEVQAAPETQNGDDEEARDRIAEANPRST